MAKSGAFFAQFFYRVNRDVTIESICGFCFMASAATVDQAQLQVWETAHRCAGYRNETRCAHSQPGDVKPISTNLRYLLAPVNLVAALTRVWDHFRMAPSELVAYLRSRHSRGEDSPTIAASFGVSRQAVDGWRSGSRKPSRAVLILAEVLAQRGAG